MAEKIYVKFNQTGAQKYIVLASGEPVTSDRISELNANNIEALDYLEQGLFIPCTKKDFDAQSEDKKKFDGRGMIDFEIKDKEKVAVSKQVAQPEKNKEQIANLKEKAKKERQKDIDKQVQDNEEALKSENKNPEDKEKVQENENKPGDFKENTIIDTPDTDTTLID